MMQNKGELRRKILELRKKTTVQNRDKWSRQIVEHIKKEPFYHNSRTLTMFVSFGDEVNLDSLINHATAAGKTVLIPKVMDKTKGQIQFFRFPGWEKLVSGTYGILEPDSDQAVPGKLDEVDLIITPGVAFDRFGGRLGYGGGYYDRFFDQLSAATTPLPPRVGVAFEMQVVERVPMESFDTLITHLVTEKGIYHIF